MKYLILPKYKLYYYLFSIENKVQNIYMCKNNEYKDFDI